MVASAGLEMNFMIDRDARQFVDTNVLVYAHDRSAGDKHVCAKELVSVLWASGTGCLSIQVLQEFYVTITRKVEAPLNPQETAGLIADLSAWRVHTPSPADLLNAIDIQQRYQLSFWDAMVIQSAMQLSCEVLWSEDLNAGQLYAGIKLINPFAA